ncbi:MAG: methyltransferase domain-containing protein [Nostocales cyanobacterium 94392]|nr:methyltransferase domain-containing protein [Nostocales cyanobacterium 94392]
MSEIKVEAQYEQLADIYDLRWRSYINNTLTFLYNWEQIDSQSYVLDVACGTGEFERLLLDKNPTQKIIGVDISEKMLNIARTKYRTYSNVDFHQTSVNSLPFANHTFDVAACGNAFHYFEQPLIALSEIKRVLKPNGKLVILDWSKDFLICRICDWILQIFDPAHQQCYTQAELHQLLISAEFNICRATKVSFGIIWGLMAVTALSNRR